MEEKIVKNAFVRKFTTKKGSPCTALVVRFGNGHEKLFFGTSLEFMTLLDMKPQEFYNLANGDYEIK